MDIIIWLVVGGWFSSPPFGVSPVNQGNLSLADLLVSLLGAVVLLVIVNLIRRGATR